MSTRLLFLCMLLLTAANALSQCRYCNSYEDFVNDKWQPLDTLYSKEHGKGYVFLWGVGGYKLTTGDKATDETVKKSFAAMQGDNLFVNGHRLKCGKLMDKFLLSRNLTKLHDKYYAEKDKDKRMQASRVIPILKEAGIIE